MNKLLSTVFVAMGVAGLAAFAVYVFSDKPYVGAVANDVPKAHYENPNSYVAFGNGIYKTDTESKLSDAIIKLPNDFIIAAAKIYDGRVYFTDAFKKRAYCYGLNGNKIWESRGEDKFIIPNEKFPMDISEDGKLWVSNTGKRRLEQLDLDTGKFIASWEPRPEFGFRGCCNPIEFAALTEGRFATMEKGTKEVRIFDASGSGKTVGKLAQHWLSYRMRIDGNDIVYYDGEKNITLKDAF